MHRLHGLLDLFTQPSLTHVAILVLVALGAAVALVAVTRLSPTAIVSGGVAAEIFSGNWRDMGVSLPIDRALLLTAVLSMILGGFRRRSLRKVVLRPIHLLLLMVATWALGSAIWAHTLASHTGFYALLDRLGLIPFVSFTLAPLLFGTPRARRILLGTLVVVGAYLGFTAVMEGIGVHSLVYPRYINNASLGISYGRARGPFLDGAANGLGLFMGGTAAAIGLSVWRRLRARLACLAVAALCGLGILFTLTRAVWVGAVAGALVGLVASRDARKYALYVVVAGVVAVPLLLATVPGLQAKVTNRTNSSQPVWDRLNTDRAALSAVEQHPLFGLGWQTFETKGPAYLTQALTYPLTGAGLEVHNVFLSHAVELGIPGSILWTLALIFGVGGAALRRGPPELAAWRAGLLAILVCFVIVANLGPLSYAFPNLVLWLLAGVIGRDYLSTPREAAEEPHRAAAFVAHEAVPT
jgi:putative inorganic carbon (hco3(-)) transporter